MDSKVHLHKMAHWAQQRPQQPALYWRRNDEWDITTWQEYSTVVHKVAASLLALGHESGECVAIISRNRPQFLFAQFGIVTVGGIPSPIYMTCTPEQVAYIVDHCRARFVFAEDEEQYRKLSSQRQQLAIEKVILMEPVADRDRQWTMLFDEFLKLGGDIADSDVEKRVAALDADDIALLIYTSGTTGHPKAVMLSHNNLVAASDIAMERFSITTTRVVSYLPLSHIAEQMITNFLQLQTGGEVYLCPDIREVQNYLPYAQPTLFMGVPRIWEKFAQAMKGRLANANGVRKRLVDWAMAKELQSFRRQMKNGNKQTGGVSRWLADRLVLSRIRHRVGFGHLKLAVSGAAPLSTEIKEFFASLGIVILEVYGMSETCGLIASNFPDTPDFDAVGKPFSGIEVKLADDGEIVVRGPSMCKGYLHDEEETAQLWKDGWLHTGDIGEFDERGFLRITDRKKALIITAGGKNIAPLPIEQLLVAIPGISIAVVTGDRKPYLVALLTLDGEEAPTVAEELAIDYQDVHSLAHLDEFRNYVQRKIETEVNPQLARYQTIKRFAILDHEFSIDSGELTPTMKVKRKVVLDKYAEVIENLYR